MWNLASHIKGNLGHRGCGNGVLRAIFGRTSGEVTGRLRKSHYEELRDLCY